MIPSPQPAFRFSIVHIALFVSLVGTFSPMQSLRAETPEAYRILPPSIELTHPESRQELLLQKMQSDGVMGSVQSTEARWESLTPAVCVVETYADGTHTVRGITDGKGTIRAIAKDASGKEYAVDAEVICKSMSTPRTIEFTNHVQSVLARNGCNMGACHGALAGKGGFRLSLRGYDPANDYLNITKQDRGRRIDLLNPAASLLLAKPSGIVEHKGGLRLPQESDDFQLLARWVSSGAPGPRETDPVIQRIEVFPDHVRLSKGNKQPLLVRAHYSNGRIDNVTRWSKFTATDESVAMVDETGNVSIVGPGEGSVTVWFASQIASARVSVPFHTKVEPTEGSSSQIVDTHVDKQLRELGLAPSPICNDNEFIRRVTLDVTGSLPTEDQVRSFLQDSAANKREVLIDQLLGSKAYVDYWAYRWSDLLMLNSNLLRADGIKAYYGWIRDHVEKNTPWDLMVREIITARGEALENGATNFYAVNQDPESMTENVCQAFLGLSIGCAKCHNHPLEKWTNDQYYAMANMFARVRAKGWGGEVRDGDATRTLMVLDRGDLIQPLRGKPQPPAPLDAAPLDIDDPSDRRIALASWLTAPENPYFTKTIVNRVWGALFGVGIVNPIDDMRASNPPSNPQLMDALCEEMIAKKYDLKQFIRMILLSETYQRSSLTNEWNRDDKKYFSHYYPKRLMAEVIHDAITDITTVPTVFDKVAFLGGDKRATKFYNKGTKAIQLFDSSVDSNFLRTFGRNQRRITCECERSDEPSIIQVLHLSNGDTLNNKLAEKGGIVDRQLEKYGEDFGMIVEGAYLQCLARFPTDTERQAFVKEIEGATADERRVLVEDLYWSLMSSREFLFNH